LNFNGTISGNVYAQPLYIEGGPSGRARVIVTTESNNVYALDAITGTVIWQRNVGAPVTSNLPCGNIRAQNRPQPYFGSDSLRRVVAVVVVPALLARVQGKPAPAGRETVESLFLVGSVDS
jgi:outer membrane protein assembly factor BamB